MKRIKHLLILVLMIPLAIASGFNEQDTSTFKDNPQELWQNFPNLIVDEDKRSFVYEALAANPDFLKDKKKADLLFSVPEFFDKINHNDKLKERFEKYYEEDTGVSLKLMGKMKAFNPPGFITLGSGSTEVINIISGSKVMVMTDGSVIIEDNLRGKSERITGKIDLVKRGDNMGYIFDGQYGEIKVEGGKGIFFGKNGALWGKVDRISTDQGSIELALDSQIEIDNKGNIKLKDSSIEKITGNIQISGNNVKGPDGLFLKTGALQVKDGRITHLLEHTDATIDGIRHEVTSEDGLSIHYPQSKELLALYEKEQQESKILREQYNKAKPKMMEIKTRLDNAKTKARAIQQQIDESLKNGNSDEVNRLDENRKKLLEEIDKASEEFKKANDQFVPAYMGLVRIKNKNDENKRNLFTKEVLTLNCKGNCFMRGYGLFWITGDGGVKTSLTDGNPDFPSYHETYESENGVNKKGRFIVTPKGGSTTLSLASFDDDPLALHAEIKGPVDIKNGGWDFSSNGEEVYGRRPWGDEYLASDLKIDLHTKEGNKRTFDLDIDSSYFPKAPDVSAKHIAKIKEMETTLRPLQSNLDELNKNPQFMAQLKKFNAVDNMKKELLYQVQYARNRARVSAIEIDNPTHRARTVQDFEQQIIKAVAEYEKVTSEWNRMVSESPSLANYIQLTNQVNNIHWNINNERKNILYPTMVTQSFGEVKPGFTQKLRGGNSILAYDSQLQGAPKGKNTKIYTYSEGEERGGLVVSGKKLKVPKVNSENDDKFLVDVCATQDCFKTQVRMRYEYLLDQSKKGNIKKSDIEFRGANGKRYILSDYRSDARYIDDITRVLGNVKSHSTEIDGKRVINPRASHVRNNFDIVTGNRDIRAGDVLLGNLGTIYHAMGISEVVEIGGETYYRLFGGSMPSIDPKIYKTLYTWEQLNSPENKVHGYNIAGILRWKNGIRPPPPTD